MNKFPTKYMISAMITLSILSSIVSGANLLNNGSFENSSGTGLPAGWTNFPTYVYANVFAGEVGGLYPTAEGTNALYIFQSTLRQNVGVFQANTVYEITFAAAANTVADIGYGWIALDDGSDGNFDKNSVSGKIINIDGTILKSAGKFYYGSMTLDTADPVYADLVGHNLNVVLISGGQFHFDDITLTPYASVGTNLLVNSSFESPVLPGGGPTPDVAPWNVSAAYWHMYREAGLGRPVADGLQSLYLFGGSCTQTVTGVIQANTAYSLEFSTSANDLISVSPGWSYVELLAVPVGGGASVQLAKVDLYTVVLNPAQWYKAGLMFNSAANSSVVGKNLVVNLVSGGYVHFDGVCLAKVLDLAASPANRSNLSFTFPSEISVALSWTLPASTSCNVYFGADPAHMTKVISNQAVNSYVANALSAGTYYWRIDVIDPVISTMPIRGSLMSFDVGINFPLGDGVNLLGNASFETPVLPNGGGNPDVAPWTISAVYWHTYREAGLFSPVADGLQALYVYQGTCQQNVGAIQPSSAYSLDLSSFANDLGSAGVSYVELLAVGIGDPVQLARLDLGKIILAPYKWYNVNLWFDTAANPSVIGKSLVVKLSSGGQVLFDGAKLIKCPSLGASPARYVAMDVPGNATLNWTLPAPVAGGPVTCNVYLGTGPLTMSKVVNNQALSSYTASFGKYGEYYWVISVKDPSVNGGNPVYGPVMSFDVIDRCQGAKRLPGFTPLDVDLNQDCQVNMLDFAILASVWIGN